MPMPPPFRFYYVSLRLAPVCLGFCLALGKPSPVTAAEFDSTDSATESFRGALISLDQATSSRLAALKRDKTNTLVLMIPEKGNQPTALREAVQRIQASDLALYYWIEVGRCRALADAHPEWMASLQGHRQWRRLFKNPPRPADNEVVKNYPWVPILNKEPFEAQLSRLSKLLKALPTAKGVFLNDIQGAPSACGCGNHLCRWTSDYGKIRTATPLSNSAPSDFVVAVQKLVPKSKVIPVWTTECEEHDGHKNGLCAGVGCYKGICWKACTEQLEPVAERCPSIATLVPYRAFQRDLPRYGATAGWISHAVKSFQTMPARHRRKPIDSSRLITVLQGWDVTKKQVAQQIREATQAKVKGYLVAYVRIEQDWKPQLYRWKK